MHGIRWRSGHRNNSYILNSGGSAMVVMLNKKIALQKYKEDRNNVNKVAIGSDKSGFDEMVNVYYYIGTSDGN